MSALALAGLRRRIEKLERAARQRQQLKREAQEKKPKPTEEKKPWPSQ